MKIGEVAAPATRYTDLLRGFFGMVDHKCRTAALARLDCAHQAGGPATHYNYIETSFIDHLRWIRQDTVKSECEAGLNQIFAASKYLQH